MHIHLCIAFGRKNTVRGRDEDVLDAKLEHYADEDLLVDRRREVRHKCEVLD